MVFPYLRVTRSYRTISDEAALVLACTPPVYLVCLERNRIRYRLQAETEPGVFRPSKAAVTRGEEVHYRTVPGKMTRN